MKAPKPKKKEKPPASQAVQVNFDTTIIPQNSVDTLAPSKRQGKFSQAFMEWRLYIPVTVQPMEGGEPHGD